MSDMKSTLKGVVRDHRLPRDYKFHFAQPSGSSIWMRSLQRYFVVRQMTKQNVTIPLLTLLVSTAIILLVCTCANALNSNLVVPLVLSFSFQFTECSTLRQTICSQDATLKLSRDSAGSTDQATTASRPPTTRTQTTSGISATTAGQLTLTAVSRLDPSAPGKTSKTHQASWTNSTATQKSAPDLQRTAIRDSDHNSIQALN